MAGIARSGLSSMALYTGIGLAMIFVTAPAALEAAAPLQLANYGAWTSPLSAQAVAGARVAFHDLSSTDGRLYWTENLPDEGGGNGGIQHARWCRGLEADCRGHQRAHPGT
ncbi:MAG: hypothetical protein WDM77_05745 [Steroidobacteraceae bacterium]